MSGYIRDGRAPIPKKASISKAMSANKGSNTKPELTLRKALRDLGLIGYRLHVRHLPGRPDIVFGRQKLAIFINGCFWHRCPTCDLLLPRSNTDFWKQKFDANVSRDKRKVKALRAIGWRTITIWECKIDVNPDRCAKRIERALQRIMP